MYTWGYIKDASLAKLDLDEREAIEQNLLGRFSFFANEAITQICSSIKPKRTFVSFNVVDKQKTWKILTKKYGLYREHNFPIVKPVNLTDVEKLFWSEFEEYTFVSDLVSMPDDFISFGDDVNTIAEYDFMYNTYLHECHDDDLTFKGYNQIVFHKEGIYNISYNARWINFYKDMLNSTLLNVPTDILDCLPSYIASQSYKIDDEAKSAIYRNEYEMFLSRIDDTDFKNTKTFKIEGDW